MGIYIKGMEMPKDCPMCPLAHWNKLDRLTGCEIVKRYIPDNDTEYWQSDHRPEWCPLVEVPPHGRLINADAPIEVWDIGQDGAPHTVKTTVSRFILGHLNGAVPPTVIEAEEATT